MNDDLHTTALYMNFVEGTAFSYRGLFRKESVTNHATSDSYTVTFGISILNIWLLN